MNNNSSGISRFSRYIKSDIWAIRLEDLPPAKAFFVKQLKIVIISIREFIQDRCPLRAASLTYYTILSIVPVLALIFAIAQGFGFRKLVETKIFEQIPEQEALLRQIVHFAQSLLENTKGGLIAGIGIAFLLWAVIKVLGNIEHSFNDIWLVKKPRTLVRKFTDYLSIVLVGPIFLGLSSSVTVFITTRLSSITAKYELESVAGPLELFVSKFAPYILIWALFLLIYIIMPNIRVRFTSGLYGALVAGTLYQITQLTYIHFQVGVSKYNAIYGGFAALPLFFIWLNISWMIVLFGAEVSFAVQNVRIYEPGTDSPLIIPHDRKLLALAVAHQVVKNFSRGAKHLRASEISDAIRIPLRWVQEVVGDLVNCGVFTTADCEKTMDQTYLPSSDINRFTVSYVLEALERGGQNNAPLSRTSSPEMGELSRILEAFAVEVDKSPDNRLLKDI